MESSSAVERLTVNQVVAGSIPAFPAIYPRESCDFREHTIETVIGCGIVGSTPTTGAIFSKML
jgi:hypothetical protein